MVEDDTAALWRSADQDTTGKRIDRAGGVIKVGTWIIRRNF
jgi:hypothetical protein